MSRFPFLGNLDEIKKYMSDRDLTSWKKYYIVLCKFMYQDFLDEVKDSDMRFHLDRYTQTETNHKY